MSETKTNKKRKKITSAAKTSKTRIITKDSTVKQTSTDSIPSDRISPWWILAGIIEIGLLGAPARIANSSSKHQNLRNIFILLFIFALISVFSSFAGAYVVYWIFFSLQIIITAALFFSFRYNDRPFATLSLYVLIGLLISLAVGFAIGISYDNGTVLPSGTTFSIAPQYFIPVNFTVYNTSTIYGSYSSTSPIYSIIISQSDYKLMITDPNYTPTEDWYSNSETSGAIYATLYPGKYTLIFVNNGYSQATVTIQNSVMLK